MQTALKCGGFRSCSRASPPSLLIMTCMTFHPLCPQATLIVAGIAAVAAAAAVSGGLLANSSSPTSELWPCVLV